MTIPRKEGGRGMTDIINLHHGQIKLLRQYFHQRRENSILHRAICDQDEGYTQLNLASEDDEQSNEINRRLEDKHQEWRNKELHGRHPHELDQNHVDRAASNAWLKCGDLMPETEGFMLAIQDQVVNTRNYLKYIIKEALENDQIGWKWEEGPKNNPFLFEELPTDKIVETGFKNPSNKGVYTFYPTFMSRVACFLGRKGVRVL